MLQFKNTWEYFCKRTYQKIVIFEECTTLTFYIPFLTECIPFVYLLLTNSTAFTYLV